MRSLQDFASTDGQPLFTEARTLPAFFQSNLLDPARVVKVFHQDPQANIRVFYYQYLKLCFELQSVDFEGYINKIETVINDQAFRFIFYEDDDPAIFSDLQFKHLIMEFFRLLGEGPVSIEEGLNRYPIMDTVLIYFFRAVLILTGLTHSLDSYIEREELLQYLCSYFGVEITLHDRCIKFVETDIFVYEEDPKEVFMAFMDYQGFQNAGGQNLGGQTGVEGGVQDLGFSQQKVQEEDSFQFQGSGFASQGNSYPQHEDLPSKGNDYVQIQSNYNPLTNQNKFSLHEQAVPKVDLKASHQAAHASASNSSRRGATEINTSYISSEFVDYTNTENLTRLVNPSSLKESGSLEGVGGGRNLLTNSTRDEPKSLEQKTIVRKVEEVSANGLASNQFAGKNEHMSTPSFSDSYTYSSQTQSYGSGYHNQTLSDKTAPYSPQFSNSAANKVSYAEATLPKKVEEYKYTPSYEWQPTKDPGFGQKPVSSHYSSSDEYLKPPSASSSSNYKIPIYQQTSTIYQPVPVIELKPEPIKPGSYTSSVSGSYKSIESKKPGSTQGTKSGQPTSYNPSYQAHYTGMAVKHPFNLNVSLEFTNSFTMKAMAEPFKTNVKNIRERARNFRASLVSYLK